MEFRHLGRSGLQVSAIAYGNWITHGSQVEEDQASACVRAALDLGITTFDTADVYAGTRAESVLGRALAGQRREGLEILTKVYWPTGEGRNDRGLSRKHILESINGSLRRLQTGKYQPGQPPPAGSRATDDKSGAAFIQRWMTDEVLSRVQKLTPLASQAGLTPAQLAVAWVLQNDNVAAAIVGATRPEQLADNVKAAGVKLDADLLKAIDEALDPIVERDPARTESPADRP